MQEEELNRGGPKERKGASRWKYEEEEDGMNKMNDDYESLQTVVTT